MQGLQQAQQQLEAYAPPPGTTMPLGAACAMGAAGLGLVRSFFPAPRLSASAVGGRRASQGFVRRAAQMATAVGILGSSSGLAMDQVTVMCGCTADTRTGGA